VIRVLIADDHAVVRQGLAALLETAAGIEVVGLAANGAEAGTLAAALQPEVVLMDVDMPVLDGVAGTRAVMAASPGSRVVMLTAFSDRERVLAAITAGAVGYLLKDAAPDDLIAAVRAARDGGSPLAPLVASVVVSAVAQGLDPAPGGASLATLSEREREILELVGRGLANKVIAIRLGIAEKTVKAHLTRIFREIGVTDRTQAALFVREHGGSLR
jgi:DNA-binding NarL/FixJ family response regulator